ncbi:hypothetical protein PENTCL1PPCAC_19864, partial [Pristionchus entomophagus]
MVLHVSHILPNRAYDLWTVRTSNCQFLLVVNWQYAVVMFLSMLQKQSRNHRSKVAFLHWTSAIFSSPGLVVELLKMMIEKVESKSLFAQTAPIVL